MDKKFSKIPKKYQHVHDKEDIYQRLKLKPKSSYMKDFVYGAFDGTVTTFAIISGVVGANLEQKTILILGMANLIADGFSMAASNYLGTKAENQELDLLKQIEFQHINDSPEGEREEVRQILINKGFTGDLLEKNIEFYTSDKDRWVELMVNEEYGVSTQYRSTLKAASITYFAFALFGAIPLLSFIFNINNPFMYSSLLTAFAFLLLGYFKGHWSVENSVVSSFKTLGIGIITAGLAYLIGTMFK
jgi:VIT1/CCC1 family predicted Fe2+/Mn2+ transporter